jgi:hypothetical protein
MDKGIWGLICPYISREQIKGSVQTKITATSTVAVLPCLSWRLNMNTTTFCKEVKLDAKAHGPQSINVPLTAFGHFVSLSHVTYWSYWKIPLAQYEIATLQLPRSRPTVDLGRCAAWPTKACL